MTRTLGNLVITAAAVAVLLGGLWAVTRGEAAAGETRGLVSEEEPELAPDAAPDLVGIHDPTTPLREAVPESGEGDRDGLESGDVVEHGSVSGVVHLPSGLDPTEPIEVIAWPIEDSDRAPTSVMIAPSARKWTFDALPLGSWVFSARAVADDHCAWGKSREFPVGRAESYEGIEVTLEEYGVRGVLTDSHGSPLPGIDVRYDLDFSDRTAGGIARWGQPSANNWSNLEAGSIRIQFGSEDLAFDGGYLRAGAPEDIMITSVIEATTPTFDPDNPNSANNGVLHSPVFDLGSVSREVDLSQLMEQAAVLEALSKQIEQDLEAEPVGSPILFEPQTDSGLVLGSVSGWNFVGNPEAMEEEAPSIPSSGTVTTDAAGRFWIALPGPGEVNMSVAATRIQHGDTDPGHLGNSTSVDVSKDAPIGDASLALERAAALMGRLVRGDGHLDDISVFLRPAEGGNTDTGSTDGEGRFKFSARKPGKYIFYARSGGNRGQDYCTTGVLQLTAGSVYLFDDVLSSSSSLTGVVVGRDGEAVAGATVTAYGASNRSLKRTGRTDQWGVFTIVGMYPVDYTIEVSGKKVAEGVKFSVPPGGGTANAGTLTLDTPAVARR